MPDGKTVTIKIETVAGNTSGAKKVISDLEKEVLESQKRVQANSRATDRAILQSHTASTNAAKTNVKSQANEFIRSMKQMEGEAKKSATGIRSSIESAFSGAFGGGLVGGAIGGFAGSIVGSIASQFAQIPGLLKTQLDEAIKIAAERANAFKGLESLSRSLGVDPKDTQATIRNLRLVKAGVVEIADATVGLKNLLSAGFSLPEATKLLEAFSDTAAFGKSAALGFGEAIKGATEGIRNGNSVLVDNVGLTKNLSAILKDAGFQEKDLSRVKDDLNVRQALYNGLIKEALPQLGDADRLTQGWTGSTAALETAQRNLYAAVGDIITRNPDLIAAVQGTTGEVNNLTSAFATADSGGTRMLNSLTSGFAKFTIDLKAQVAQEIATLQELANTAYGVANAFGWLSTLPSLVTGGPSAAGAQFFNNQAQAERLRGSYQSSADRYKAQSEADFNFNRSRQVGPLNRSLFPGASAPLLSGSRGGVRNDQLIPFGSMPGTGSRGPETFAGGGGGGGGGRRPSALPRTKSARVNLNLKDEMSDALEIAAKYGLVVTSGKDSKHNVGSAHYAGGAFDIRSTGVSSGQLGVAINALREAGYSVKDERTRPPGQAVWGGPHMHVSGAGRGTAKRTRRLDPDTIDRQIEEMTRERGVFADAEITRDIDLSTREKIVDLGKQQIAVYEELATALFNLNEHSKEENFLFEVKLGKYPQFNEQQVQEIANTYKLIDATEAKKKADQEAVESTSRMREEQQRLFDDTARGWEDLLTDLASGNFSSIWKQFREQMLSQFIKPASQYLAQLFGNMGGLMGGGMQTAGPGGGFGGGGFNLGSIFNRGMGPGGTPNFNPAAGGLTLPAGAFGGTSNFGASAGAGNFGTGLLGSGGGSMWPGFDKFKGIGAGLKGVGGSGGGFGGMLRGMGGGSMMGGIAGLAAMGGQIAGSAIGGGWGNVLSLGATGAMIGLEFGGPWGAAIGGAIGAGAGLISMLFNKDDSIKKLKAAAASEFGISVKDKSVLKQLKAIGEQYFGKGQAGKNAQAVVRTEEGMNILRAYAESSGQSGLKIDRLNYGDENWSGNQVRSKFAGFRQFGGPVTAGMSYIVGERRAEVFTPNTSGTISPSVGASTEMMAAHAEAMNRVADELSRIHSMPADQVIMMGASGAKNAIAEANNAANVYNPRGAENTQRSQGVYY